MVAVQCWVGSVKILLASPEDIFQEGQKESMILNVFLIFKLFNY